LQALRQAPNALVDQEFIAGNMPGQTLLAIVQESIAKFVERKVKFISFYYESEPSCEWRYVTIEENVPPPPPQAIKIIPNTPERKINVTWLTPANNQRDVAGFKLYKRERVGNQWEMVKEFGLRENWYEDFAVKMDRAYIYALTSVDVHGTESVLSTQIRAQLNPQFLTQKVEKPQKWVSGSGAHPRSGFANVFKKFFEPEVPIIAKSNVVIGPQASFRDQEKKLLVRIKSLDIHESKEFVVTLANQRTHAPEST
jgi:hypothetical protein